MRQSAKARAVNFDSNYFFCGNSLDTTKQEVCNVEDDNLKYRLINKIKSHKQTDDVS